jgi:hypothetical protein
MRCLGNDLPRNSTVLGILTGSKEEERKERHISIFSEEYHAFSSKPIAPGRTLENLFSLTKTDGPIPGKMIDALFSSQCCQRVQRNGISISSEFQNSFTAVMLQQI